MANKNTLLGQKPQEPEDDRQLRNIRKRKRIAIVSPNGTEVFDSETTTSQIGDDGVYDDSYQKNAILDTAGNPLPSDPHDMVISHSGLYTPLNQRGLCSYFAHPNNISRNVFIGQDGRHLPNGQLICSVCEGRRRLIYAVVGVVAALFLLGIYRGLGIF